MRENKLRQRLKERWKLMHMTAMLFFVSSFRGTVASKTSCATAHRIVEIHVIILKFQTWISFHSVIVSWKRSLEKRRLLKSCFSIIHKSCYIHIVFKRCVVLFHRMPFLSNKWKYFLHKILNLKISDIYDRIRLILLINSSQENLHVFHLINIRGAGARPYFYKSYKCT